MRSVSLLNSKPSKRSYARSVQWYAVIQLTHGQLRERQTQVKERENRSGVLKLLMRVAKGSARRSVW